MNTKTNYVGQFKIKDGIVTVTDPCYDKGTRCTLDVHMEVGNYNCYFNSTEDTGGWGNCITSCYMIYEGTENFLEGNDIYGLYDSLGAIGVDAGLAGFFENKPNYSDTEWIKVCDKIYNENNMIDGHGILKENYGFATESGYGDGIYEVRGYHKKDNGEYTALQIIFIEDDDNSDDDEYDEWYDEDE